MDMSDNEREQQNKRLYCDSPPDHQKKLVNIPSKDRDYSYMDKTPKKSMFLCECGKDWKFWAGISITGLILFLTIGNWELGFLDGLDLDFTITFEVPIWVIVAETYFIVGMLYLLPLGGIGFGLYGLKCYCDRKSIWHKDMMAITCCLMMIVFGTIGAYLVFISDDNIIDMFWRMMDSVLEHEVRTTTA